MKKSNFITDMVGALGGKRAGRTAKKPKLLEGIFTPSYKRFVTRSKGGKPARGGREMIGGRMVKVWHQGDRIKKGRWSDKRWARAIKVDSKRSGAGYEDWERPHKTASGRIRKLSWK